MGAVDTRSMVVRRRSLDCEPRRSSCAQDRCGVMGSSGEVGPDGARRRVRLVIGALLLDAFVTLPAALTGAVSVFIREDLAITDQRLGLALSSGYFAGAVMILVLKRALDALGWRRTMVTAIVLGGVGLSGIAVADGPRMLTVALLFSGAGVALMMPATNLLLVTVDGTTRLAQLLAVKQASVPIALLLAGLAVPPTLAVATWRALFIGGLFVAPVGLLLVWRLAAPPDATRMVMPLSPPPPDPVPLWRRPIGASRCGSGLARRRGSTGSQGLAVAASGVAIASCLPGALTAYLVISLVDSGMAPATAALLYGGANIAGIIVRISAGIYASRVATEGFLPVASMMILGGFGALLLGTGVRPLLVLGASLAFGLGWGWPGLLFYAVMNARPGSPAAASAAVHAGGLSGAAAGPIVAGAVAVAGGWIAAWSVVGALSIVGGALVAWTARRLKPESGLTPVAATRTGMGQGTTTPSD
jgi:MFS family permease